MGRDFWLRREVHPVWCSLEFIRRVLSDCQWSLLVHDFVTSTETPLGSISDRLRRGLNVCWNSYAVT